MSFKFFLKACLFLFLFALLSACGGGGGGAAPVNGQNSEFVKAFDDYWQNFYQNYPSFGDKQVDWVAQKAIYRAKAEKVTSYDELVGVLKDMTMPLRDGHILFMNPAKKTVFTRDLGPENYSSSVQLLIKSKIEKLVQGGNNFYAGFFEGVPYINITSFSDCNAENLGKFNSVMDSFRSAESIIIDLRENRGGSDICSSYVAGRFMNAPVVMGYNAHRSDVNKLDEVKMYLQQVVPQGDWQYSGRIVVLIGGRCASACDFAAYAFSRLPNAKLVGSPTAGFNSGTNSAGSANIGSSDWHYNIIDLQRYSPPLSEGESPDAYEKGYWGGTAVPKMLDGHPVAPNMVIDLNPNLAAQGVDSILEEAIRIAKGGASK